MFPATTTPNKEIQQVNYKEAMDTMAARVEQLTTEGSKSKEARRHINTLRRLATNLAETFALELNVDATVNYLQKYVVERTDSDGELVNVLESAVVCSEDLNLDPETVQDIVELLTAYELVFSANTKNTTPAAAAVVA